jgi:hypothetical protein
MPLTSPTRPNDPACPTKEDTFRNSGSTVEATLVVAIHPKGEECRLYRIRRYGAPKISCDFRPTLLYPGSQKVESN